jgi:hypothetical protein
MSPAMRPNLDSCSQDEIGGHLNGTITTIDQNICARRIRRSVGCQVEVRSFQLLRLTLPSCSHRQLSPGPQLQSFNGQLTHRDLVLEIPPDLVRNGVGDGRLDIAWADTVRAGEAHPLNGK